MDGQPRWVIREEALDECEKELLFGLYTKYPTAFTIKLHYGGALSKYPGRKYVGGTTTYVDQVNADYFSVHEIDRMIVKLGYSGNDKVFYHFKKPNFDLDFGLVALGNDEDVLHMLSFIGQMRVVFVYIEHGITTVFNYFRSPIKNKVVIEQLDDEPVERNIMPRKRRKRLYLEWKDDGQISATTYKVLDDNGNDKQMADKTGDCSQHLDEGQTSQNLDDVVENLATDDFVNDNPFDDDFFNQPLDASNVDGNEPGNEGDEAHVEGNAPNNDYGEHAGEPDLEESSAGNDDEAGNEGDVESDLREDDDGQGNVNSAGNDGESDVSSDFEEDDINQLNDVEVDMSTFKCNVDRDYHWKDRVVNPEVDEAVLDDEVLGYNFDEFDSGDEDGQPDRERRRKLKVLRRKKQSTDPDLVKSPFYVGQKFYKKRDVTELVKTHAIATRRDLRCLKNDLERVRVRCCGATPGYIPPEPTQKVVQPKKGKGKVDDVSKGKGKVVESDKGQKGKGKVNKGKGKDVISDVKIPDKPTCPWTLHVSKGKGEDVWLVKTLIEDHKCNLTRELSCCNSSFLAKHVSELVKSTPSISGKGMKDLLEQKLQLGITQNTIYKAKEKAKRKMKGAFQDQYKVLRDYILELQNMNPETTVKLEVQPEANPQSETRVFKRIYVCLGALKNGFKAGKRELIGLDGAFMKGPYPGQVLTAVGVDSNNGIYPVAYAIVESENLNSWTWFLNCLGDDLGLERNSNFTFITDRQKGLIPALAKVFPATEHRFCLRHIYDSMVKKFKGSGYKDLIWKCATKTTLREFEEAMDEMKAFDAAAHDWLRAIPPRSWARSHFSGRAHCDILLNNICESFNSKIVDGRDQPIITCLEYIREYLMKRIVLVQKAQDKCHGTLTPTATLIFENIKRKASEYVVTWNGGDMYQCNGAWEEQVVVNMRTKECACRRWDLTGFPCKHAVASLWNMSFNGTDIGLIEDWVHPCYRLDTWKEAYSFKIQPTNGINMWPMSECPTRLLPPIHHTPIGRPKKKRSRGINEVPLVSGGKLTRFGKIITCGKCGNKGHNQSTCKGQGGESSQSQSQNKRKADGRGKGSSGRGGTESGTGAAGRGVGRGRGRGSQASQTGRATGGKGSGSQTSKTRTSKGRGGSKGFGGWF